MLLIVIVADSEVIHSVVIAHKLSAVKNEFLDERYTKQYYCKNKGMNHVWSLKQFWEQGWVFRENCSPNVKSKLMCDYLPVKAVSISEMTLIMMQKKLCLPFLQREC